jgi:hypothetical protein
MNTQRSKNKSKIKNRDFLLISIGPLPFFALTRKKRKKYISIINDLNISKIHKDTRRLQEIKSVRLSI